MPGKKHLNSSRASHFQHSTLAKERVTHLAAGQIFFRKDLFPLRNISLAETAWQ